MSATATETKEATLHVARIQAENFLKIKAIDIPLGGKNLVLSGPNGSGKTSILDLVWVGLGGAASKALPEPIRHGEAKATSKLELAGQDGRTQFVIERQWTEKATKLVITAGDGSQVKRPQDLLNQLFDEHTLDPSAFLRRRPAEQVEDLLAVFGVASPVDRVREILGEDFPTRPGESALTYLDRLAGEDGSLFVRRRDRGRILQQKEAAFAEQRRRLEAMGADVAPPASTAELLTRRGELQQKRDQIQAVRAEEKEVAGKLTSAQVLLQGIQKERAALLAESERLYKRLREIDTETEALAGRIAKGEKIVEQRTKELKSLGEAVAGLADPAPAIAELDRQIADHEQRSKQAAQRQQAVQQVEVLQAELLDVKEEHGKLERQIAEVRKLKTGLLDGVELPIQGLEVGEGELRLNGVSFRQASHAERLRVACALACRRSPQLKILRLDDAEHLDKTSRELLLKIAREHGFQCLLAFVADVEGLQVEMVEA